MVVPLSTIRELDHLKSRSGLAGRNARRAVRFLDGVPDEEGRIIDPKVVSLRSIDSNPWSDLSIPTEWDPFRTEADTELLVLAHSAGTLVTNDTILRVKARHLGIRTMGFQPPPVREEPPFTGVLEITQERFGVDVWYGKKGEGVYPLEVLELDLIKDLCPNQFLVVKGTDIVLRFRGEDKTLLKVQEHNHIKKFKPRNLEQRLALDLLLDPEVHLVTLLGRAGGGKTLCALAAGVHQTMAKRTYQSMVVTRPILPMGRDIGYLPGGLDEKLGPWLQPIKDNLKWLLGDGDASRKGKEHLENTIAHLQDTGLLEVQAMPHIRGRSISRSWLLVDEAQGTTAHEIKTILTRPGEGTKVILTGDIDQIDHPDLNAHTNGLSLVVDKFRSSNLAGHVTLVRGERSPLATLASKLL